MAVFYIYAGLYLDRCSHLSAQTRMPEANWRKMNKKRQFLIRRDDSSDSEEPVEGWKANNHDTHFPSLLSPRSPSSRSCLSYQRPVTEYTTVGQSITVVCLSSLSCHWNVAALRPGSATGAATHERRVESFLWPKNVEHFKWSRCLETRRR